MSRGLLIGAQSLLCDLSSLVRGGILGDIAQEISFHLVEEDLGLRRLVVRDQRVFNEVEDVLADTRELSLNCLLVVLNLLYILSVTLNVLLLLDAREHAPGGATCAYDILECNSQDVTLLDRKLLAASTRLSELSRVTSHLYNIMKM